MAWSVAPLSERWFRLMEAVMSGTVVPFLGAGVSATSRAPGAATWKPTVGHLIERMQPLHLDAFLRLGPPDLTKRAPQSRDFSWHAELASRAVGQRRLVESLGMREFDRLFTLTAHRFIARLCREGFVSEVLTTNWDTCLERAWRGTFRHRRRSGEENHPQVVRTREEYANSARPRQRDPGEVSPTRRLRVVKLNGCAGRFVAALDEFERSTGSARSKRLRELHAEANAVVLTDLQLSRYSDAWKPDMLRDRLRTHRMVFCGFGADEPQVRYLVAEILKERPAPNGAASAKGGPRFFVSSYEAEPSFPQLQLILTESRPLPSGETDGLVRNLLHGPDAALLTPAGRLTGLPADLLWRRIYQAAMWRRVFERLSDTTSAAFRWLAERSGNPRTGHPLLTELRRWLGEPPRTLDEAKRRWAAQGLDALVGRQPWLWDEINPAGDGDHTMLLPALLRAARGLPTECPEHLRVGAVGPNGSAPWQWEFYRRFEEDEVAFVELIRLAFELLTRTPTGGGAAPPPLSGGTAPLDPASACAGLLHPLGAQGATLVVTAQRAGRRVLRVEGAAGAPPILKVCLLPEGTPARGFTAVRQVVQDPSTNLRRIRVTVHRPQLPEAAGPPPIHIPPTARRWPALSRVRNG